MNTTLILHPRFSIATPVITAREVMLAALCAGLKAQVVDQATQIARLEEQNRALTKALHRQCAGFTRMDVLITIAVTGVLIAAGLCGWEYALAAVLLMLVGAALTIYAVTRCEGSLDDAIRDFPGTTAATPRARHFTEPAEPVRIIHAIRRAPIGQGYPDDESEFEDFERGLHEAAGR